MGWMVIIGHRSSKSTFGANDVHDISEKYFFRYLHMMMTWKMMVWSRVCKDLVIAAFEQVGPTQEDYRPGALQLLKGGWWRASSSTTPSSSSLLSSSLLSSSLFLSLRSCQEGRQGALQRMMMEKLFVTINIMIITTMVIVIFIIIAMIIIEIFYLMVETFSLSVSKTLTLHT